MLCRADEVTNRAEFGATHESGIGTNRTNRAGLMTSVVRGRPEVTFRSCQGRF